MADERGLNARTKLLYNTLLKELRKGVPLSDAMHQCAPAFPELLIAMTRSAEGTGSIDASFLRMGRYYDREHKVNQQVGNSLMYPIILSVMIVGVIAILMGFVVPQFMPMFEQMDSLPLPTVVLFAVSDFVSANWVLIILVAAFLVVGGRIALAQPAVRRQWDRMQLHAPVIGKLNQKICTARFARTLSNLSSSGVPIVATLIASRDAVGNRWIISQFDEVLDKVRGKLDEFVASPQYPEHLKGLLAQTVSRLDGVHEMVIQLRREDLPLGQKLADSVAPVKATVEEGRFQIGGLVALCPELGIRADCSFAAQLEELGGHFAEIFGLSLSDDLDET